MTPYILISRSSVTAENYINAVISGGGDCAADYCPAYDIKYDGLILAGGGDMHPEYLGEPDMGSINIDKARDACELKLIEQFLNAGKPIFGICRGIQVINVYFGGSLIQDLPEPSASIHRARSGDAIHITNVAADSPLSDMFGPQFSVNSAHHQAIREPGKELYALQWTLDGTVEGLRHRIYPVFGVQWHPERMCLQHKRPDTPDMTPLFKHFINICANGDMILI